tara:strand:+ start:2061 stop:2285 length:225 start_codon:yes stop_codon:yes gene_type:complete
LRKYLKSKIKISYNESRKNADYDNDGSSITKPMSMDREELYRSLKDSYFSKGKDYNKVSNLTFDEMNDIKGLDD